MEVRMRFERGLARAIYGPAHPYARDSRDRGFTAEEVEALRRQHLELLLLGAQTAAAQQDGTAYPQTLRAAGEWLIRYFDLGTPEAARMREEIDSLAAIDVDPPRPAVGAAARALRRVVQGGAATP